MALIDKNTIPTSYIIDLSTIDRKIDKLVKYFKNCDIDLRSDGLRFINPDVQYSSLEESLRNKKYKQSLSTKIDKIYNDRFEQTRQFLTSQGLANSSDFLFSKPIDDFGSRFDAFAATNTNPDNLILKTLNVTPYKYLKIDILTKSEFDTYNSNIIASYESDRLSYLLSVLNNITSQYLGIDEFGNFTDRNAPNRTSNYVERLKRDILSIKLTEQQKNISQNSATETIETNVKKYENDAEFQEMLDASRRQEIELQQERRKQNPDLVNAYPDLQEAVDLFEPFQTVSEFGNFPIAALKILKLIEPEIDKEREKNPNKFYQTEIIESSKIKILNYIIKQALTNALESSIYKANDLTNFSSNYSGYNFYEQKFVFGRDPSFPESESAKKEDLIFKLTFLRQQQEILLQKEEEKLSDLKIEFKKADELSIVSPFGNSETKDNKFVAIIIGNDLANGPPVEFFEPTILSILSDIDFIDANIYEIDPFYCPTPESLNPNARIAREEYRQNEVIVDKIENNKYFLESNVQAFDYRTFPDQYFIPNFLKGAESFFQKFNSELTRSELDESIKKYSKYYYNSQNETPSAILARDQNMSNQMRNILIKNSFYGLYESRKDSFSDPFLIQQTIKNINSLGDSAITQIQDIIFAKTNIACLLKEFQTCFLPKVGNCRDVLRGFKFSELEEIVKKVAPQSVYPALYASINRLRSDLVKDEREKQLLEEIENLENQLNNNERKKLIYNKLDRRIQPQEALIQADTELGISNSDTTIELKYKYKLKEYKDFKQDRSVLQEASLDETQIAKEADEFLKILEENNIDISKLCELANYIVDLTGISFTFGKFSLPELPEFDAFQELKASIDLSVVQIIFQAVVEFILKLLQELLTCNGLKDLISAAITGDASGTGLTTTAAAALNQMARGQFDLDDFVDNNPQIDPREFKKSVKNTLQALTDSVSVSSTTELTAKIDLGVAGQVNAKSKAIEVLNNPAASAETEQEIYISFTGLIAELSEILEKTQFINLVGGKPLDKDLVIVSEYIKNKKPELIFISEPRILRNLFNFISNASGLSDIRDELYSVGSLYANKIELQNSSLPASFCEDVAPTVPGSNIPPGSTPETIPVVQIPKPSPVDTYRDFIRDLLVTSPQNMKNMVDDKIFKPILIGKLPNGQNIKQIEQSNRALINLTLKPISEKFKESSSAFYSTLAYKKKINRQINKYIIQKNKDTNEEIKMDNPEFIDKINSGIGKENNDSLSSIIVEENKYVYGGLFTEEFLQSSNNFNIESTNTELNISIYGDKGNTSETIKILKNSLSYDNFSKWKVISRQTNTEKIIGLYEGGNNISSLNESKLNEIFSYKTQTNNTETIEQSVELNNKYVNLLKNNISNSIVRNTEFDINIKNYLNESYEKFLSFIYQKITEKINEDALLKKIDVNKLNSNDPTVNAVFPLLNIQASIPLSFNENPNIDTPLKYINFSPKQTEEQKLKDLDPSLYGIKEITNLISGILDKRNNEFITNLSDLKTLIDDKDNPLNLSLIDGLYMSLIRVACSELCFRSLFVLRTFKYDKKLLEDLLLSTFISDMLYKEIFYYSNKISKKSLIELSEQHINYLHDYIFDYKNEDNLFLLEEIKQLKNTNESLNENRRILISYKNKNNFSNRELGEYEVKLDNAINCLKEEIKLNKIKIMKLQLRNLAYNEFLTIFDKLSYITSTNEKVLSGLDPECREDYTNNEGDFLKSFLPNALINSELYSVAKLNNLGGRYSLFYQSQSEKYKLNNKIIFEEYVYVGEINRNKYPDIWQEQQRLELYGIQAISSLKEFLESTFVSQRLNHGQNIKDLFMTQLLYGIRVVHVENNIPSKNVSVLYDSEKTVYENFYNLIRSGKNKLYLSDNAAYNIKNVRISGRNLPINLVEKTYAVPYLFTEKEGTEEKKYIGLINSIPITKQEKVIDISSFNRLELIQEIKNIQERNSDTFLNVKLKITCDQNLSELYNILSTDNLLPNMLILSSIGIMGNNEIKSLFTSVRTNILASTMIKLNSIQNKNNFEEIYESLVDPDIFKQFNAGLAFKVALKAAVYVLQYYCQMTDPNISNALMIRNAIKLFLSTASQIPNPFGENQIPSELPPALSPLAIYSMVQLPINIFGVPPAGFGVGVPITPSGLILLAVEILLLGIELSFNIDKQNDSDSIKKALKDYCIDLQGYKKYGIE